MQILITTIKCHIINWNKTINKIKISSKSCKLLSRTHKETQISILKHKKGKKSPELIKELPWSLDSFNFIKHHQKPKKQEAANKIKSSSLSMAEDRESLVTEIFWPSIEFLLSIDHTNFDQTPPRTLTIRILRKKRSILNTLHKTNKNKNTYP